MPAILTQEQFISRANEAHSNKYDYSKVAYVNGKTHVNIICPIHGEFHQSPHNHMSGQGCPACKVITLSLTLEGFISKASDVHGTTYSYANTVYTNSYTPVDVECLVDGHGVFQIKPKTHLEGFGCPICRTQKFIDTANERFIDTAKALYGHRLNYTKTKMIDYDKAVTITCISHGDFTVSPRRHLAGHECPKCNPSIPMLDTESCVANFRRIHGDKYDYSKVVYTRRVDPVTIICPEHGEFRISPNQFVNKAGCPECGERSKWLSRVKDKPAFFYIIMFNRIGHNERFFKIGITVKKLGHRFSQFGPDVYTPVVYSYIYKNPLDAYNMEYKAKKILSKWHCIPSKSFKGSATECFTTDADLTLLDLPSYTKEYIADLLKVFFPDGEYDPCYENDSIEKVRVKFKHKDGSEHSIYTELGQLMMD